MELWTGFIWLRIETSNGIFENDTKPSISIKDGDCVPPKRLSTRPHGVATQKINTDISTAVRTSNLISLQIMYTPIYRYSIIVK
jgi:hypothetical protein